MKKQCFLIILTFLLTSLVLSEEKEIIIGGDNGWDSFSFSNNISITNSGRFGKQAVQIATNSEKLTSNTDLLLDFEQEGTFQDLTGNYSILSSNLASTSQSIMGKQSALGRGKTGGLELLGKEGSIFGKEGLVGSFTISFWLNPSLSENGETVFLWDSSRNINNSPAYQLISIVFFQNKLEWNFTNIFSNVSTLEEVILKSNSLVIPNVWAHHSVSFDEITGIIEYKINGKVEALLYATESGWAERNIYNAILGTPASINLCPNYSGRIDDFSITKEFTQGDFNRSKYTLSGGYFETQPLGPFPYGSSITKIQSISNTPNQTDIQYFVRAGDNFYEWTNSYPEWIPVTQNQTIENVHGRFFQIATNLFTDGSGENTPNITEIRLQYNEAEPPLPPFKLFAEAGDGYVDLSWIGAAGQSPNGYIVYYGEASGEYMGESSFQGDSPIDVGQTESFRITGLSNGKAYYFAVSAYSYTPTKTEGFLSQEAYARPLKGRSE